MGGSLRRPAFLFAQTLEKWVVIWIVFVVFAFLIAKSLGDPINEVLK